MPCKRLLISSPRASNPCMAGHRRRRCTSSVPAQRELGLGVVAVRSRQVPCLTSVAKFKKSARFSSTCSNSGLFRPERFCDSAVYLQPFSALFSLQLTMNVCHSDLFSHLCTSSLWCSTSSGGLQIGLKLKGVHATTNNTNARCAYTHGTCTVHATHVLTNPGHQKDPVMNLGFPRGLSGTICHLKTTEESLFPRCFVYRMRA